MPPESLTSAHACQHQVGIAHQPFIGYQQYLARRQHVLLFALEDGVAKVEERDAYLPVIAFNHYRHVSLEPVALPDVAPLHAQWSYVIDMVCGLYHLKSSSPQPWGILAQPVNQWLQ